MKRRYTYKAIIKVPSDTTLHAMSEEVVGEFDYVFAGNVIKKSLPMFVKCKDHHSVALKLKKVGVISKYDDDLSTKNDLVVRFRGKKGGRLFIDRLNRFINKSKIKALKRKVGA